MKTIKTKGIVLKRINYGEADRIVTFLTPEAQISAIAKGARRQKSKLAGGIELFSASNITLIKGRGSLDRLISARAEIQPHQIAKSYDKLMLAYMLTNLAERTTRETVDPMMYDVLVNGVASLSEVSEDQLALVELWTVLNWLKLLGEEPNLNKDLSGKPLSSEKKYNLNISEASLVASDNGQIIADHIKTWRLALKVRLNVMLKIKGAETAAVESIGYLRQLVQYHHG